MIARQNEKREKEKREKRKIKEMGEGAGAMLDGAHSVDEVRETTCGLGEVEEVTQYMGGVEEDLQAEEVGP
ncbi:hypothetical protein RHS04_06734 [Rhizoctonia solani]|uniref:Uncharacterized protein n=1 Tax=Rhizoctonia solani TaxID=456999 RepID=A0A8H7H375_9AGAM|nr:hypothetical protein RHS04_06734 [Rhizoctonia solani]